MRFMVTLRFHIAPEQQADAQALIPQEQAHVRDLTQQGIIEGFFMSADRAIVWLVMRGDSRDAIAQTLTTFPLYLYMQPEYTPLA